MQDSFDTEAILEFSMRKRSTRHEGKEERRVQLEKEREVCLSESPLSPMHELCLRSLMYDEYSIHAPSFFRSLFPETNLLSVGVYGIVLEAEETVLKFCQPHINDECLIHEYCVLRLLPESPHFPRVYGLGKSCPPLIESISGDTASFYCHGPSNFIMMENVKGVTLRDAYSMITLRDYIAYTLQVLQALPSFITHNDLHDNNIILRSGRCAGAYNDTIYETPCTACIIDFGVSYYEKDGEGYGFPSSNLERYGVSTHNKLSDAYKLLCYTLRYLFNGGEARMTTADLRPLFAFFNPKEDTRRAITQQSNVCYFYPLSSLKLEDYLSLLARMYVDTFQQSGEFIVIDKLPVKRERKLSIPRAPHITSLSSMLAYTFPKWLRDVISYINAYVDTEEKDLESLNVLIAQVRYVYYIVFRDLKSQVERISDKKNLHKWYFTDFPTFYFLINLGK